MDSNQQRCPRGNSGYGRRMRYEQPGMSRCGCDRQRMESSNDCGCQMNESRSNYGRQMMSPRGGYGRQMMGSRGGCNREDRREEKPCGCNREERREEKPCGCNREERREEKPCGCDREERRKEKSCDCDREKHREKDSFALGMAYVPWQSWNHTYDAHRALMSGTIFPELDKPFCAAGRCGR